MREYVNAVIIAGGDVTEKIQIPEDALVICADCGYCHALAQGITPDVLVGDFDSYTGQLPENIEIIRLPVEKDDSDTGYAVRYAKEHGVHRVIIYGACGGDRIDHMIANLQVVHDIAENHMTGILLYGRQILVTVRAGKSFLIPSAAFPQFSVFAMSDVCKSVNITGAKYNLKNASLINRFPLGLSNQCNGTSAKISVREGIVLLVLTKK